MKFQRFGIIFVSLFSILSFYINAHAAPGDLDTGFGASGITRTNFDYHDYAVQPAILPDGKILVAGYGSTSTDFNTLDVFLARYNSDGSADNSFGTSGKITVPGTGNQVAVSLLLRPDGKFFVVGYEDLNITYRYSIIIYLFNSNGTLDTTFGTNGKVTHSTQNSTEARAAALQTDGKIVIAGGNGGVFTVFRLNTNGSLDTGFNSVGYNTVFASPSNYIATAVAIQSDGKIVVGSDGWSYTSYRGYWGRFNSDGTLEGSLIPGIITSDIAIQPNGKIIFVGTADTVSKNAITRFNADKTLDTQFGNSGENTVSWNYFGSGRMSSVLVEPSGRIVVGGMSSSSSYDSAIARFNSNGFLDVGFGNNGKVVTSFAANSDYINNIVQQPDGKIVAVGAASNATDYDFFVARYNGGDSNTLANRTAFDFDGDGRSDLSVFRPSQNAWYQILSGTSTFKTSVFGTNGDIVTPADFDGDGKTEIAIFRPSTGQWWFSTPIEISNTLRWGQSGDIPLPSDFDGDGKADLVVYRPSTNTWLRRKSGGQSANIVFGSAGDKPLIADFDGDGKTDPAIYRPSNGTWWYAASSANNEHRAVQWGLGSDIPVPADFDGDRKTDFAVYRPSEGVWYILNSSGTYTYMQFGLSEDKPVAADYDGDGKADIAVYRPSNGVWYLMRSTAGFNAIQWGISTDIPSQNAFIPQ